MLPYEIKPFADHHREELEKVHKFLDLIHQSFTSNVVGISAEDVLAEMDRVQNAREALRRFEICMADEVQQKIRMRDRWFEATGKNKP